MVNLISDHKKSDLISLTNNEMFALFGQFDYKYNPTCNNPDRITINPKWVECNIVNVELPQLKLISHKTRIKIHKKCKDQFLYLLNEWEKKGLINRILTWNGSFSPRFVRGNRKILSNHAFGAAFDINAKWNKYGVEPSYYGELGCVRELVGIANSCGFLWGGDFKTQPDGMHFEIAVVL